MLIFALENLIFMLYPYRLNEEGLSVFLRSILTFTGKGIIFTTALTMTLLWALASKELSRHLGGGELGHPCIFAAGMWCLTAGSAITATWMLSSAYRRFDPSQDAPATS